MGDEVKEWEMSAQVHQGRSCTQEVHHHAGGLVAGGPA